MIPGDYREKRTRLEMGLDTGWIASKLPLSRSIASRVEIGKR